ncbi:nickel ABC transporter permease [Domibacillus indicus]|uniref:nickel ABC transporter permease n=1 Tax=Domibacillus indicus TaxID=1437523 RepID=UPI0006181C69|nr:nickel ABC transporter permease [Domibacillus indicus]
MIGVIGKRLAEVIIFVLILSFASFVFVRLAPGDPVLSILRVDDVSVTKEQIEAMREELGFNDPLLIQYGHWLLDFIKFDFGTSYVSGQPVMSMMMSALPATLELAGGSLLVLILFSVPLGSLAALYKGSWVDHASRIVSMIGAAVPSFWLGLILIDLLAVRAGWFPTMGRNGLYSLILPCLTLGLAMSGVYVRLLRASLLESMGQEFIRAGRARGLSETRLFFTYTLRHSLPPIVTVFGLSLGSLIGGVVVIEVIFSYPGIGKLVVDSIRQRDYPVIQGYMLIMAAVVFIVNSLVDLSYQFINPGLKMNERKEG